MRARHLAILAAIALIASACQAAAPSASSPPASAAPSAAAPSVEPSAADVPTTLRVARISDFLPSIHPVDLGTGNQELMADIVFSTLVDVDSDEVTILPDLATTWTASPDATVYTFKLNPAAVWSDGEPVTADDVIFTIAWSAQQDPTAFKQIPVDMWLNVVGGDAVAGNDQHPRGRQEDRRSHGRDHPQGPDATFLRRIAGAVYYILPAAHRWPRPDRRAGPDLRVLPRHRRCDDRLRPVRLLRVDLGDRRQLHRARRTTGRARTPRSTRSSTRSRSRTSPSPSSPRVSSTSSSASRRPRARASWTSPASSS